MAFQFELSKLDSNNRLFLTWAPIRVRVRQVDVPQPTSDATLTFRNGGSTARLWFSLQRNDSGDPEIQMSIPGDGRAVDFWLAGEFQNSSQSFGDAELAVFQGDSFLGSIPAMVRVRKDANTLTETERDRFLAAFGVLNGQGSGRFAELRAMHTRDSDPEAHGNSGFPPWHRAYLLDLERELQAIDPQVTLPYWRFDQPAPNVFSTDFMGAPDDSGFAHFSPDNPLGAWVSDNRPGIFRQMNFAPEEAPRPLETQGGSIPINNEMSTLLLGGTNNEYGLFRTQYEGNPHGFSHVSFTGHIGSIPTAVRDPLFFMLHANVDRLWAKWQWLHARHDSRETNSFADPINGRVGHNLNDSMWPWNGVVGGQRPSTAPGGSLQSSETASLPGNSPTVVQMLDYMNVTGQEDTATGGDLGFCYDDVPFEFEATGAIT